MDFDREMELMREESEGWERLERRLEREREREDEEEGEEEEK